MPFRHAGKHLVKFLARHVTIRRNATRQGPVQEVLSHLFQGPSLNSRFSDQTGFRFWAEMYSNVHGTHLCL